MARSEAFKGLRTFLTTLCTKGTSRIRRGHGGPQKWEGWMFPKFNWSFSKVDWTFPKVDWMFPRHVEVSQEQNSARSLVYDVYADRLRTGARSIIWHNWQNVRHPLSHNNYVASSRPSDHNLFTMNLVIAQRRWCHILVVGLRVAHVLLYVS
jgi:hypothetical protein